MTAETAQLKTNTRWAFALVGITLAYNIAEAVLSIVAGIITGSVALVGFGFDSTIEVSAGVIVLVHLLRRKEENAAWEQRAAQFIGVTFILLAIYVGYEAVASLVAADEPDVSYLGIGIAIASLALMPAVSVAKHRLAHRINSRAHGSGIARDAGLQLPLGRAASGTRRQRAARLVVGRSRRGPGHRRRHRPRRLGSLHAPRALRPLIGRAMPYRAPGP